MNLLFAFMEYVSELKKEYTSPVALVRSSPAARYRKVALTVSRKCECKHSRIITACKQVASNRSTVRLLYSIVKVHLLVVVCACVRHSVTFASVRPLAARAIRPARLAAWQVSRSAWFFILVLRPVLRFTLGCSPCLLTFWIIS